MIIDLESQRLGFRDSQEFHFECPGNDEYFQELEGRYVDNLRVNGLLQKSGTHYLVRGRLETVLELHCSRCLERFQFPVDIGFQLNLADSRYQDEYTLDEDVLFYNSDEVDIKPFIEQLVYSEIPMTPLCKSDCRGLCPECGTNQNIAQCQCQYENTDPRWDKLKNLKAGKEVT